MSPSLDVCECSLWLHVTSGMSGTFLTSAHLRFSRGGTKLQSFLLVTISQHYTTHVLSRPHWLCSRTISLTEEHYLWCQLPAGVKIVSYLAARIRSPHSGHYDTLCFSPVILSCLNHVMAIWQCRGEGRTENTLALWLLQGLRDGENDDLCWQ